jgi:hypothetical protein
MYANRLQRHSCEGIRPHHTEYTWVGWSLPALLSGGITPRFNVTGEDGDRLGPDSSKHASPLPPPDA